MKFFDITTASRVAKYFFTHPQRFCKAFFGRRIEAYEVNRNKEQFVNHLQDIIGSSGYCSHSVSNKNLLKRVVKRLRLAADQQAANDALIKDIKGKIECIKQKILGQNNEDWQDLFKFIYAPYGNDFKGLKKDSIQFVEKQLRNLQRNHPDGQERIELVHSFLDELKTPLNYRSDLTRNVDAKYCKILESVVIDVCKNMLFEVETDGSSHAFAKRAPYLIHFLFDCMCKMKNNDDKNSLKDFIGDKRKVLLKFIINSKSDLIIRGEVFNALFTSHYQFLSLDKLGTDVDKEELKLLHRIFDRTLNRLLYMIRDGSNNEKIDELRNNLYIASGNNNKKLKDFVEKVRELIRKCRNL